MEDRDFEDDDTADALTQSDEALARRVRARMAELEVGPRECADLLRMIKDPRDGPEIMEELLSVLSGGVRAPGFLMSSLTALVRLRRRAVSRNADLVWNRRDDGVVNTTTADGYKIGLKPKSGGRWLINLVDPSGSTLEWRIWLHDLEAAKIKALMEIEGDPDADRELQQSY